MCIKIVFVLLQARVKFLTALAFTLNAISGKVSVTINDEKSNEVNYTIIPVITGIDPASGSIGTTVTINGTGFRTSSNDSYVRFITHFNHNTRIHR